MIRSKFLLCASSFRACFSSKSLLLMSRQSPRLKKAFFYKNKRWSFMKVLFSIYYSQSPHNYEWRMSACQEDPYCNSNFKRKLEFIIIESKLLWKKSNLKILLTLFNSSSSWWSLVFSDCALIKLWSVFLIIM